MKTLFVIITVASVVLVIFLLELEERGWPIAKQKDEPNKKPIEDLLAQVLDQL